MRNLKVIAWDLLSIEIFYCAYLRIIIRGIALTHEHREYTHSKLFNRKFEAIRRDQSWRVFELL